MRRLQSIEALSLGTHLFNLCLLVISLAQYTGGDLCTGSLSTTPRSLRLWFLCYNDQGNVPREETVLESSM